MSTLTIPNSIDVGTPLDATEVQANNNAISSWANGNIDDDNMLSGYKIAPAFSTERRIWRAYGYDQASGVAGTSYLLTPENTSVSALTSGSAGNLRGRFYWDTTNYSVTGRTTYWRISAQFDTNNTAANIIYTVRIS